MRGFPNDETCLTWLWQTRYAINDDGTEAICPHCQVARRFERYETAQQRQSWTCVACGLHVHPTAGTVFHKSSTSLHLWFYAMYLMTSTRCGISAKQRERELGVTYKTAWRIFTLIRNEVMTEDDPPLRLGEVAPGLPQRARGRHNRRPSKDQDGQAERPPMVLLPLLRAALTTR